VIVPLTLKLMVVATVGEPFAVVIAARRLPAPVSLVLVTVIAALASAGITSNRKASAVAANAKRRVKLAIGSLPPHRIGGGGKFQLLTD
jgi:hypothetical protein